MPRFRQRACLQDGLKLDLNKLARAGLLQPDARASCTYTWTNSYTGERTASALITAQLQTVRAGWFRIEMGELDQWIDLVSQPRHFGGRQWYFKSPITHRCSVLWMPPGAPRFCGRHELGRHMAYASQFDTPIDRAHRGKAKIKARLIGTCDPDEWVLLPKPKWMRWGTYSKLEQKFDAYEGALNRSALARGHAFLSMRQSCAATRPTRGPSQPGSCQPLAPISSSGLSVIWRQLRGACWL